MNHPLPQTGDNYQCEACGMSLTITRGCATQLDTRGVDLRCCGMTMTLVSEGQATQTE